ncbi:MAG TPA: hypothetical protein VI299_08600 [Polyangiales bacterium]
MDGEGGPSNDAGDTGTPSDASFDAEIDGASLDGGALDAADGSRDAAGDGGGPDNDLDGSTEGGTDASLDGASSQCDGMVCAARCDLTGTYAVKMTVPTTWPGTAQISGGSGTFEFWLKMGATHVGNQAAVQLRECHQHVPVIRSLLVAENYLFTYPDSLFDSEVLPSFSATMTLGDSTPSSSLSLPPVAMELGVNLSDPLNDPWPNNAASLPDALRVDAEGDGNPSVTAIYSNAGIYVYPPTSASLFAQRAQQAYIAVRWVFSMTGALTSCDGSQGSVTLAKIDSRIVGCRHADGSLCSVAEANHLDTNLPKFQFGAGTYVLSRVAADAVCPAVRAALP